MKRFKLVLVALMLVAVVGLCIGCPMDADGNDTGNSGTDDVVDESKTGYRGPGKGLVFFYA